MQVTLAYRAPSIIQSGAESLFNFAPNVRREPVFFQGGLRDPLLVRDALLNLHDVVTSDFDTRLTAEDWNRILDPVATVAPDQMFFEAFSQDESSYGRVALRPGVLSGVDRWESGTTNVDFTPQLANSIGALRSSSTARFQVDPEAFSTEVNGKAHREKKVKLPKSWLRGFLNVQSAMTGELSDFEMSRADLRNLLAFMKSHKEKFGPRALVFKLKPGEKVEVVWEPWNHRQILPGSVYRGSKEQEIRLFGRRRLFLLNRILPKMQRLRVFLSGSGLPSFWLAALGDEAVTFHLAISGWTTRPFAASNLFLSDSQEKPDMETLRRARAALRADESVSGDDFARKLNLAPAQSKRLLALLCAQGQAMFDLETRRYRKREVLDVPLDDLKLELDSSRLEKARELVKKGGVKIEKRDEGLLQTTIRGEVKSGDNEYPVAVTLDSDGKIVDGDCECSWFHFNALRGGPCRHILAMREAIASAGSDVEAKQTEWWEVLV
ncbi:MAG TPA: SWIM zinc finger family protein [Abditibacteriaceae bacterium]